LERMRLVASFDGLEGSMATTIGDRPFTMIGIAWFGTIFDIFATNEILFGHKTSRGFKIIVCCHVSSLRGMCDVQKELNCNNLSISLSD